MFYQIFFICLFIGCMLSVKFLPWFNSTSIQLIRISNDLKIYNCKSYYYTVFKLIMNYNLE